ncbi:MAG: hypothetical protein QM820_22070 [Minicystis sp.]
MILSDLIESIYQYYPQGMYPDSPGYDATPERHRQMDAMRRAAADHPRWAAMLDRLRQRFEVDDRSMHISGQTFDSAFSAMVIVPDEQGRAWDLGFHVSLLGPYYVVHRMGRPGEEAYAQALVQEIEATYGYAPIPPELGDVVVPAVALETRRMGEATVYDCLLSAHWGGRGWMESRCPFPRHEGS